MRDIMNALFCHVMTQNEWFLDDFGISDPEKKGGEGIRQNPLLWNGGGSSTVLDSHSENEDLGCRTIIHGFILRV